MCDKQGYRGKGKKLFLSFFILLILLILIIPSSATQFNLSVNETGDNYIIWKYDTIYNITNISIDGIYQSVIPISGEVIYNNLKPYSGHIITLNNGTYTTSLITYTSIDIWQFIYSNLWLFIGLICLVLSPIISIWLGYFSMITFFTTGCYYVLINSGWESPFIAFSLGITSLIVTSKEGKNND